MIRLRFSFNIEPYLLKISAKYLEVYIGRGGGLYRAFLSEDVPKGIV